MIPVRFKRRCAGDGRGVEVTLTDAGLETLQRAYPVHLRSVRAHVLGTIPRASLPVFAETIREVAAALE